MGIITKLIIWIFCFILGFILGKLFNKKRPKFYQVLKSMDDRHIGVR